MLAPRSLVKGRRNTITLNCKLLCVAREDVEIGRALIFYSASRHQVRRRLLRHSAHSAGVFRKC